MLRSKERVVKLALKEKGAAYILLLSEKVDKDDVGELALFLAGIVKRGSRDLVLDLTEVQSLVSAAIGVILAQVDALQQAGKRLVIVGPNERVAGVLRRMGVTDAIPVYPDRDAALAALAAP